MPERELVVLGTSSQVPTRTRAHHGALLRWDRHGILLDPGEGTQRQMLFAGVSSSAVTHVCITHAHGDHCLGLAGVLQRLSLDGVEHVVEVHFPAAALPFIERLRHAASYQDRTPVRLHADAPGVVAETGQLELRAVELSHRIPTLGWRFEEPEGRTLVPQWLEEAGVHGPARSELQHHGRVRVGGRTIHVDEMSVARPGQAFAFVMDTRWCEGALELATGVDLLLIEATFRESERDLAEVAGHLTAAQAARIAHQAGARKVVLTHFSQRYDDVTGHLEEARRAAPGLDLTVAADLDRIAVPPRTGGAGS